VLILVRGACVINGTINANGTKGGPGIDTDGTAEYTNAGTVGLPAIDSGGSGGLPGPGGGAGGHGAPQVNLASPATTVNAAPGVAGINVFGESVHAPGAGGIGAFADLSMSGLVTGGGGGGYGTAGSPGQTAANGGAIDGSTAEFTRLLSSFTPERCFQPGGTLAGGPGGGGGGISSADGSASVVINTGRATDGDDCGGGGGGGGGAIWMIADTISIGNGVAGNGQIHCDGGRGGNTYNSAGQTHTVDLGPDGMAGGGDDVPYISGVVNDAAAGTGAGGAGGGGAGGAILMQARTSLTISSTATMTALGGAGGTMGSVVHGAGGAGGKGRITLMTFAGSTGDGTAAASAPTPASGTFDPAATLLNTWKPTVDSTSAGVSHWLE
jgi:hypothetical protein